MRTGVRILIVSALGGTLACGDSTGGPSVGGLSGTLEGPDIMLTAGTEHVYTVGAYMGEDWESFDGSLVSTVIRADSTDLARRRSGLPSLKPPGRPIEVFPIEHGRPEVLYTAWELPEEDAGRRSAATPDGRLSAGRAFEPRLHFEAISDGRLAVVDSIGYRVKLISRDGEVVGAVERPIVPLAVTEAMRDAQRERYVAREVPSNVGIFRVERESVDRLTFADEVPVIANIAVDWEDRIWVQRRGEDGTGPGRTDIVTPDGGYIGTLPADGVRIPRAFGPNGLMAYITTDEFGVQVVRVIRLVSLQPQPQGDPS